MGINKRQQKQLQQLQDLVDKFGYWSKEVYSFNSSLPWGDSSTINSVVVKSREVVVMTYLSILSQIRTITKKRYKESDKSLSQFRFTTSYQSGFLVGLSQKLDSDKESFLNMSLQKSERESYELTIVNKTTLVKEYLNLNMNLKTVKSKNSELDKKAFSQGIEDGSEKGLNQQLGA